MTIGTVAASAIGLTYANTKLKISRDFGMLTRVVAERIRIKKYMRPERMSYIFVLEDHAQKIPDKLALIYAQPIKNGFDVIRYTYKQLYEAVLKYADVLRNEYHVHSGDTVALCCKNSDEYIFIWMAIWSLNATPAFINYNLRDKALIHSVITSGAKCVFVDVDVDSFNPHIIKALDTDKQASFPIQTIFMNNDFHYKVSGAQGYKVPDGTIYNSPEDTAILIYTSGTTGLPKPAVVSWQRVMAASQFAKIVKIRYEDVVYTSMPLYHGTASALAALPCIMLGSTLALGRKFSATTFWQQVKLCDATVIQYVGEACRYLVNAPYDPTEKDNHVRMAYGNGLRQDVWANFKERFNIPLVSEFYAATDFPGVTFNIQYGDFGIGAINNMGAFGNLFNKIVSTKVAALDPEDPSELFRDPKTGFGRVSKVGEPGEFVSKVEVKSAEEITDLYKGNPKASQKKIIRNLFAKGDFWIRSGDAVRRSEDGLMYFVDRMGDTFRWKSENVSTTEIENLIHDFKGVEHVAVVGIKVPHHEGRAGFAVIKLQKDAKLNLSSLAKYLLAELPRYAVPIFLKFSDQIHVTGNNKTYKANYRNQKIPDSTQTIYWLKDEDYIPITLSDWKNIESRTARL